jgi:hypothetical protein
MMYGCFPAMGLPQQSAGSDSATLIYNKLNPWQGEMDCPVALNGERLGLAAEYSLFVMVHGGLF